MNARRAWVSVGAGLAVVVSPGLAASAASAAPNDCVQVNGGDWRACNVGHRGGGDLPYLPVQGPGHSAARCIQVNQGDASACRVGSVGGYYRR